VAKKISKRSRNKREIEKTNRMALIAAGVIAVVIMLLFVVSFFQ
jgi:hypothetical protein